MALFFVTEIRNESKNANEPWFDDSEPSNTSLSSSAARFIISAEIDSNEKLEVTFDKGANWHELIPSPGVVEDD